MRRLSLFPCCRSHPAGVVRRLSLVSPAHAVFVLRSGTRPPRFRTFEATTAFTCVTARELAHHPLRWLCRWASALSVSLHAAIQATGHRLLPWWACFPLNTLALPGHTTAPTLFIKSGLLKAAAGRHKQENTLIMTRAGFELFERYSVRYSSPQ